MVGIGNAQYFREQFNKVFGMNPSEYIKKYRNTFANRFTLNRELIKPRKEGKGWRYQASAVISKTRENYYAFEFLNNQTPVQSNSRIPSFSQ